jgi:hypothetical protein
MRTSTSSRPAPSAALAVPGATAFWLEDDSGNRVSKLFASSEKPLKLAGRVLENVGSLKGWTLACRTSARPRHALASGTALESLAIGPDRTPEEAEAIGRFHETLRRTFGPASRARVETDETVY